MKWYDPRTWFRKPAVPAPKPTPLGRLVMAVDELNDAIQALPDDLKHLRTFNIGPDYRKKMRQRVVLGWWERGQFIEYGETEDSEDED